MTEQIKINNIMPGFSSFKFHERKLLTPSSYRETVSPEENFMINGSNEGLILIIETIIISGIIIIIVYWLNQSKPSEWKTEKLSSYECGFFPFDNKSSQFYIKFYLIAIIYLIFDLEIIILFPFAYAFFYLINNNLKIVPNSHTTLYTEDGVGGQGGNQVPWEGSLYTREINLNIKENITENNLKKIMDTNAEENVQELWGAMCIEKNVVYMVFIFIILIIIYGLLIELYKGII